MLAALGQAPFRLRCRPPPKCPASAKRPALDSKPGRSPAGRRRRTESAHDSDTRASPASFLVGGGDLGSGVLRKPPIVVGNFTGADPTLKLAGAPLDRCTTSPIRGGPVRSLP
jgi:hypothetical protein